VGGDGCSIGLPKSSDSRARALFICSLIVLGF
jgi:hypothetical protein